MDQSTIMAVLKGKVSQSKSPIIEETIPHDKTNLLKFLREASRNNTDNVSKIFDNHTLLDGSKIEINNSLGLLKDGKPWLLDGKRVGAIEKVQQLPN